MNLLHDVPLGDEAPETINVVVEIPKGSFNKYEIDKETGLIKLDRANYSSAPYPVDYGFAPRTYWDDGDALDVIVLTTWPLPTGILVNVRPVAIMDMTDSGDPDAKIIGVPVEDKRWDDVKDLKDLNQHTLKEIRHFFETYKALKGKPSPVVVHGYKGRKQALAAIKRSQTLYAKQFVR